MKGKDATTIASNLGADPRAFARPRRVGVVNGADGFYKFPGAETELLPDVGFVEAAKVSAIDHAKPISFAPDLAIEGVSPSQKLGDDEMAAKSTPTPTSALGASPRRYRETYASSASRATSLTERPSAAARS